MEKVNDMSIDFSTRAPYCNIKSVTIDGNDCVFIPAFYYKVHTPTSGAYVGQKIWSISADKATINCGYTLHPAFMHNGVAQNGFYFSAYGAYNNNSKAGSASGKNPWVNITIGGAKTACTAVGSLWHLQTIYERHAIAMLMLTELGTSDVQSAIGSGNTNSDGAVTTGSSNAVWRGIHEFWGNVDEWFDGFYSTNGYIHIFNINGDGTYVDITKSVSISSGSGFAKVMEDKGTGYDLNSVFIPADATTTAQFPDCSCVNTTNTTTMYPVSTGIWRDGAAAGAFVFYCAEDVSISYIGIGFRAARYVS